MGGAVARVASVVKPRPSIQKPINVAPTVAEVSQATATSADGYDSRLTKRKGRSATIMTGSQGIMDDTITLGRKSLLGQ
jgi:hypothetical protein